MLNGSGRDRSADCQEWRELRIVMIVHPQTCTWSFSNFCNNIGTAIQIKPGTRKQDPGSRQQENEPELLFDPGFESRNRKMVGEEGPDHQGRIRYDRLECACYILSQDRVAKLRQDTTFVQLRHPPGAYEHKPAAGDQRLQQQRFRVAGSR